jgi:hypothetical protein
VDSLYLYKALTRFTTHDILVEAELATDRLVSQEKVTYLFSELLPSVQRTVTANLNKRSFQVIDGKLVLY